MHAVKEWSALEPLQCRKVDLARAALPPGAPLDPGSAAHVRECSRCREAMRLDALGTESLRRLSKPGSAHALTTAGRARLEAAVAAHLSVGPGRWFARAGTSGQPMTLAPYLAAAAVVALSIALGTRLAEAVSPPHADKVETSAHVDAPLLGG